MKNGFSLMVIIFLIAALLATMGVMARIGLNSSTLPEDKFSSLQAFYLAEAGIEKAKYEISKNPNWYTDLPHSPVDDAEWIKNNAKGKTASSPVGIYKIVREKDKMRTYAIGFAKKSVKIIKIEFRLSPFLQMKWELL